MKKPKVPRTWPHRIFRRNMRAVRDWRRFMYRSGSLLMTIATSESTRKALPPAARKGLRPAVREFATTTELLVPWITVLFVTFLETYLQDVLAAAAWHDPSLMSPAKDPSEIQQKVSYNEVAGARSVRELLHGMRMKWARNFVDDGGPTRWMRRLTLMGADGFNYEGLPVLEEATGVRHLLVHRSGIVGGEFLRHHPRFKEQRGKNLDLEVNELEAYRKEITHFVSTTDAHFIKRLPQLTRKDGRPAPARVDGTNSTDG